MWKSVLASAVAMSLNEDEEFEGNEMSVAEKPVIIQNNISITTTGGSHDESKRKKAGFFILNFVLRFSIIFFEFFFFIFLFIIIRYLDKSISIISK